MTNACAEEKVKSPTIHITVEKGIDRQATGNSTAKSATAQVHSRMQYKTQHLMTKAMQNELKCRNEHAQYKCSDAYCCRTCTVY